MKQGQGRVSILTFMQRTELSQDEAMAFLEAKIQKFQGTTYETLGNIYYEFDRWRSVFATLSEAFEGSGLG
jgi:hypothetical protein